MMRLLSQLHPCLSIVSLDGRKDAHYVSSTGELWSQFVSSTFNQ